MDRDGIINALWYDPDHGIIDSPLNPDQFSLLPRAAESVKAINQMGFLAIVISNQPTIAKGKTTLTNHNSIQKKMMREMSDRGARLDGSYYCFHHPDATVVKYREVCECRKPKAGLLLQASKEMDIDLKRSYMIGDGVTDVQAGDAAGCSTVWVGSWKCDICQVMTRKGTQPNLLATDIEDAIAKIKVRERM